MNTTRAGEGVMKQDVLGRVWAPKARREELLDEFEGSGLSGQRFAALVGIKYQTFATWAQRRRQQRKAAPAGKAPASRQLRWVEAVVVEEAPREALSLVVHLPGGARVEIGDAKQAHMAATLLRALEHPGTLREMVSTLQASLAAAQAEITLLRQKLDALARRFFGVSSEALNPAQLQLLLSLPDLSAQPVESAPAPTLVEKRKPSPRSRAPRLPDLCRLSKR